jgi:hypothetical protein
MNLFFCTDFKEDETRVLLNCPFYDDFSQQPENCENRNDPDLVQAFACIIRSECTHYAYILLCKQTFQIWSVLVR